KSRRGGTTLIFIDEIQEAPEAIAKLRYFFEEAPDLYVIAAGSLLETLLHEKVSVPVGRVEYRVIRPVAFDEYLGAMSESLALAQYEKIPIDDFAHDKLLQLFHRYAFIGGMPEAIQNYALHKDITKLKSVYESLLISYLDDIEKYSSNLTQTHVLRHTLRAAFLEAGSRIKFQNFGNSNYGSREEGEALRTLEKALLLHLVYPTVHTVPPLQPDLRKAPRLHVLDTGLMNHFAGIQKEIIRIKDLQSVYQGKMIEHLVGQELLASHFTLLESLNFWVRQKKESSAEVDYLLQVEENIIPLEVKSGAAGKLRSLHLYMDQAPHPWAVRFYSGKLKIDTVVTPLKKRYYLLNLPYYLAGQVEKYIVWMIKTTVLNAG
ncbi:MAG: DUF4143 domain-containing protein, partial [Cyclobacteriaceae bacterium]